MKNIAYKKSITREILSSKARFISILAIIFLGVAFYAGIKSSGPDLKESINDPTAHAEIIAIREAAKVLGSWRLNGCEMYVTLEPCTMCAGAIVQSRISKLYIGTYDPRAGGCGTVFNITQSEHLNHWVDVKWLYNEECSELLQEFFYEKRRNKDG